MEEMNSGRILELDISSFLRLALENLRKKVEYIVEQSNS